jgi:hypothetical protein
MGFISRDMLRSPKLHLIWYNLGDLVLLLYQGTRRVSGVFEEAGKGHGGRS